MNVNMNKKNDGGKNAPRTRAIVHPEAIPRSTSYLGLPSLSVLVSVLVSVSLCLFLSLSLSLCLFLRLFLSLHPPSPPLLHAAPHTTTVNINHTS